MATRIDGDHPQHNTQLAGLGCCFCSVQFIVPERTLQQPELIQGFLRATQRGAAFTTEHPKETYELLCQAKPQLRTPIYQNIFMRTLPFFSRTLNNVSWQPVTSYAPFECFTPSDG